VRRGALTTTPRSAILEGITREAVLTIAADLGIAAREEFFTRDQLYTADEAFFSAVRGENSKYRSWLTPVR